MARSAKIYDFTIQPNGSFELLVEGSFYRIQQATGAIEVRRDGGSGVGPIYPGQGERDEEFKRLTLVDKTGAVNRGFIVISDGSFVDDRVTGSVEVIDGGKNRTISNAAFWGYTFLGASAGNLSSVQLFNPVGSGKRCVVEQVTYASISGNQEIFHMGYSNAPLSLLAGSGVNKHIGNSVSTSKLYSQNSAAPLVAAYMADLYCPLKENQTLKLAEPIVLNPGFGLIIDSAGMNVSVSANFEFYEEVIL